MKGNRAAYNSSTKTSWASSVGMEPVNSFSLRELEDLIIDCFYNELLQGKLDQKNQCLEVHMTYCRDAQDSEIDDIIKGLEGWDNQLGRTEQLIQEQMKTCNQTLQDNEKGNKDLADELATLRTLFLEDVSNQSKKQKVSSGLHHHFMNRA